MTRRTAMRLPGYKRGNAQVTNISILQRKGLRAGAALQALALMGAGVGMVAIATPVSAQDYVNVTAAGRITDTNGKALAGATVQLRSNDQGFSRQATTDSSGSYRVPQLPPGNYTYTISAEGYDTFTDPNVALSQNQASNSFQLGAAGAAATDGAAAARRRDRRCRPSRPDGGLRPDHDRCGHQPWRSRDPRPRCPLVARRHPTGTGHDAGQFGPERGLFQPDRDQRIVVHRERLLCERPEHHRIPPGLLPVPVPFDFYDTVDIKTGGFQAEFGRATGGVVNATTKRGSNEFHGSVLFNWEPNDLASTAPNTYLADNDGDVNSRTETVFQLSGPIIKDRLFFYGLYQFRDVKTENGALGNVNPANNRSTLQRSNSPFYGGKIDAIITDGHRLEGTYFNTTQITNTVTSVYDSSTNTRGAFVGGSRIRSGGANYVGRYTGTFAPWITLSAAYGVNKNRAGSLPLDTVNPSVVDQRSGTSVSIGNPSNSITTNDDKREFYRGDVDLYFKLLGSHHVRGGYDREDLTATQISTTIGEGQYNYFTVNSATDRTGLPIGTQYASARFFENGGSFGTRNEAFYIQDSWSLIQDRVTLQLGIRNDRFTNKDADGKAFYKSGDQWGPRLGFTADPLGDGRNKIFGSFSRYYTPVAANTNIRGAGRELDYTRFNLLTGVNANGTPILGAPILTVANSRACPDTGVANCTITSNGEVTDPTAFIAKGLKPQSLDEYIIGVERRLGNRMRVGLNFKYRKLGEVLEDVAIDQAAIAYCTGQGFTAAACGDIYSGFSQYVLVNPGRDASIQLLGLPDGTTPVVDFTAAQLGYPRAERTYKEVTATFDREFDGVWSLSGSYTWSDLKGNYEGGAKSDVGQADTGATQDFDQPGFTLGSYGYLPGHRRHSFKLYGSYQIGEFLTLGANGFLQSPKKFGCIGVVPTEIDPFAAQYGAAGNFCQGVATQRGKSFESDWRKELNLTVQFRVPGDFNANVRFDVFNVFNTKSKLDFDEFGDLDSGGVNPNYRAPLVYQQPRSARIQLQIGF
ncbi:TonB-dependent receptor [Sphingomonas aerolata]|uniref:TonB-dependent receptor n=1 Tax=Sphingomonas aerolata TaxID=185951 RepID=UPI002FE19C96